MCEYERKKNEIYEEGLKIRKNTREKEEKNIEMWKILGKKEQTEMKERIKE